MADYEVTAVNFENNDRERGRIRKLCGPSFSWEVAEVVRRINGKLDTFYVQSDGGPRAEVLAPDSKDGRPAFVTTNPDDSTKDNLRKLPAGCL